MAHTLLTPGRSLPAKLMQDIQTFVPWAPRTSFERLIREAMRFLPDQLAEELKDYIQRIVVIESSLGLVYISHDGKRTNYGTVSRKVVTDAGVAFIVDAFQGSVELENMKYHGLGTGTTAEAASQTALVTELTTQYNPNNTRATGSTTEGASANIYRTVGTNTVDGAAAVTEHGVFDQASNAGGVMLDRSVFSAVNLASGDSLQSTYELTCTSGG
jgi:hypothetical protein